MILFWFFKDWWLVEVFIGEKKVNIFGGYPLWWGSMLYVVDDDGVWCGKECVW